MLYVHGGFARTGTTSLQAALYRRRGQLRGAGIVYPEIWLEDKHAHHGFAMSLKTEAAYRRAAEDLRDVLRLGAGKTTLISTEQLSTKLSGQPLSRLLALLSDASRLTRVTGLWTLRRMDSFLTSVYLLWIWNDRPAPTPTQFFQGFAASFRSGILGMQKLEAALGGGVVYGRYDAGGAHHGEILESVGVPGTLLQEITEAIRGGPRLNPRLTQKAAIAMIHTDAISARVGVRISRPDLREALFRDALRFDDDAPCELVGTGVRRAAHEKALEIAATLRFDPYLRLFGRDEIRPAEPVSLDPDLLTDADLDRLAEPLKVRERL